MRYVLDIIQSSSQPLFVLTGATTMPKFLTFPSGLINALQGIDPFISWILPPRSMDKDASFVMPWFYLMFSGSWIGRSVRLIRHKWPIPNLVLPAGSCPWKPPSSLGPWILVELYWWTWYDDIFGDGDWICTNYGIGGHNISRGNIWQDGKDAVVNCGDA